MKNVLGFDLPAADSDYAPMSLGQLTYGATVREMVDGYTMFVNDGVVKHTITYTKLFDNEFNLVYENVPETSVAISNVTAYWMTNLLSDAIQHGTGRGANITNIMACAGKTGTTTDMKDRWFSGFTPYYVAVVWTGYDTPAAMSAPNGNPASALWKKVMTLVHQDLPYLEFEKPSDTYLKPVPGVDPEVQYTIRGVTLEGEVLYETSETAMKGKDITATAGNSVKIGKDNGGSVEVTDNILVKGLETSILGDKSVTVETDYFSWKTKSAGVLKFGPLQIDAASGQVKIG
jgi:penicillin-binding protein 1A